MGSTEVSGLSQEESRLLWESARAVLPNAYAPYSRFPVAVAMLCDSGGIYTGVNVENAALPLGSCAERVAVGNAVTAGERAFRAILILAVGDRYAFPCGACRQLLYEFGSELSVILSRLDGATEAHTLRALLPDAFGSEDLLGGR